MARKWHPDRHGGDTEAFATVAQAYEVLKNETKREILNRLGEEGLARLRDGDPTVRKDWIPPDEVLRRVHNDGPEPWSQKVVTSSFAALSSLSAAAIRASYQWRAWLGLESVNSSVYITAKAADGGALRSGGSTQGGVTFIFALTGRSEDFTVADVEHNCTRFRFLGMKSTYYPVSYTHLTLPTKRIV
eukprot:TRINITY_DN12158_c0_g1_i1.p1 TRINITY_DN12158_c0_g1~~TRINITY_DN12158_c0_g1_i1.p1  ORF type:complete len:188 (+),score=23.39 TRINITY_DN12158_c0_g1_i1:208-771(+)